jgi:hypothetical protein
MNPIQIIGKLAAHPRGKRLHQMLESSVGEALPEGDGVVLAMGSDYQNRSLAEQRTWLEWAARPGRTLLLLPPFRTGVRHEPNDWEIMPLESPPKFASSENAVLRLTAGETSAAIKRGLLPPASPAIGTGSSPQLNGLHRRHPDSGLFAVTTIPIWSLALADSPIAVKEWLAAWLSMSGQPVAVEAKSAGTGFEPTQLHFALLLHLLSGEYSSRQAALEALAWSEVFDLSDNDAPRLLGELENAGLAVNGSATSTGKQALLDSPYREYAIALSHQPTGSP